VRERAQRRLVVAHRVLTSANDDKVKVTLVGEIDECLNRMLTRDLNIKSLSI
jgi:hypothetical protein